MTSASDRDDEPKPPQGRFVDDLIGLDPQDPEVKAFAQHLDRIEKPPPPNTVEGYIDSTADFASGIRRARGLLKLAGVVVVLLILLGVLQGVTGVVSYVFETFFG
ncbi:hypothetical protein D5S17_04015 [Pseudonocardiaceae bacterium YIM PH 21723]|nr:hypothetical protein D5S17_04015 [Pseudonocardiaceae bacterium YIM PH 21723]